MSLSGRPISYERAVRWMMQCVPSEIRQWLTNPHQALKARSKEPYYQYRADLAQVKDDHYTMMVMIPFDNRRAVPAMAEVQTMLYYKLHIHTGVGHIHYQPDKAAPPHRLYNPTDWGQVDDWIAAITELGGGE